MNAPAISVSACRSPLDAPGRQPVPRNRRRGKGFGEARQGVDGFRLLAVRGDEQPQPFRAQVERLQRRAAKRQGAIEHGALAVRARRAAQQPHPRGAEPQGAQDGRGGDVAQARHLHPEDAGGVGQRPASCLLDEPLSLFTAMEDHHPVGLAAVRRQQPREFGVQGLRRWVREPQGRGRARRGAGAATLATQMVDLDPQAVGRVAPDRLVRTRRYARAAGLLTGRAAGAAVGIIRHVHGLEEVAGEVVDPRRHVGDMGRLGVLEHVVSGGGRGRRRLGIARHDLVDHKFPGAFAAPADDGVKVAEAPGYLEKLAPVRAPGRRQLDGRGLLARAREPAGRRRSAAAPGLRPTARRRR